MSSCHQTQNTGPGSPNITKKLRTNEKKKQVTTNTIVDTDRLSKIKISIATMLVLIFTSGFLVVLYNNIIEDVKNTQEATIYKYKSEQFEKVWDILCNKLIIDAHTNIKTAADSIESSMQSLDMDKLKSDLDSGIYTDDIIEIFKSNLENISLNSIDNGKNNTLVMSNDKIILNYSYYAYPNTANDTHLFSSIITSGYNKELGQDAINKIYQQSDNIICAELMKSNNKNHIAISSATKENFKKVYMEEGLDGFRNYQFFVPVYITEKGDIFGQDDIVYGERLDVNHKFIIIQEFNLYDQLLSGYPEYFDESFLSEIEYHYEITLRNLYTLGIFFVIFLVITLFEFISVYNNFICGYLIALQKTK